MRNVSTSKAVARQLSGLSAVGLILLVAATTIAPLRAQEDAQRPRRPGDRNSAIGRVWKIHAP
jgi:hypothetical protein